MGVGCILTSLGSESGCSGYVFVQYFTLPHRLRRSPLDSIYLQWTPLESAGLQFVTRMSHTGVRRTPADYCELWWTPADSSKLQRTPADYCVFWWTLPDSSRFQRTPADSGGLRRTFTSFYAEILPKIRFF